MGNGVTQNVDLSKSIFNVGIFGQQVFVNKYTSNSNTKTTRAIYYTKIFQKKPTDIWQKVTWADNQSLATFGKIRITVNTRTGSDLPILDYTKNTRYTLDQLNSIIENQSINVIDGILERFSLNRSVISNQDLTTVDSSNGNLQNLGTSYNSARLISDMDAIWNYWSFPIQNSPSFIPENRNYNFLQAKITLESLDFVTTPELFYINFTSSLIQ